MLEPQDIKALREFLELSPTQLAANLGVSENTVRRWEIGDRHPKREHLKVLNGILESAAKKGFKLPGNRKPPHRVPALT